VANLPKRQGLNPNPGILLNTHFEQTMLNFLLSGIFVL